MKLNELTRLIGTKVVLVPYEAHHVPKYHQWMTDPKLLEATASESLSIEEEYDMQKTWRDDDDKLTFIVLDKEIYYGSNKCEISSMVGDVNLFISEGRAEVEIMIAESSARGKGCGTEAVLMMMGYALEEFSPDLEFSAKIGFDNETSNRLFTANFGFVEESRSEVFREISYILPTEKRQRFIDYYKEKVTKEDIANTDH